MTTLRITFSVNTSQDDIRALASPQAYVQGADNAMRTRFYSSNQSAGRVLNSIANRAKVQYSARVTKAVGVWNATDMSFVSRSIISQMAGAARANWNIDAIVAGLPPMGSGSTRPNLFIGEPSNVERVVTEGEDLPTDFSDISPNPIASATVAASTTPGQTGTIVPSGTERGLSRVKSLFDEYRTPVIITGVAVTTVVTAVVLYKVFK